MIPNVGLTEAVILLAVLLLLFGAKRTPELARGLGSGLREFRKGTSGEYDERRELEEGEEQLGDNGSHHKANEAFAGREG